MIVFEASFYVTIADADIGNLNKCLDHMLVSFEQNHMVRAKENFVVSEKRKMVNNF